MKYLNLLSLVLVMLVIASCDPDDLELQGVKTSSIDSVYAVLSGPASAIATGTNASRYSMNTRGGSTYEWSVTGADATITTVNSTTGAVVDIVWANSAVDLDATVTVTETTTFGLEVTREKDVAVGAYCAYDVSLIEGVLDGSDNGPTASQEYPSVIEFTYVDDNTITFIGANELWVTDYWGEEILDQYEITMKVDDLGLYTTIATQPLFHTLYDGDEYDYTISGTGIINGCTGVMTINYKIGGAFSRSFVVTLALP